MHLEFMRRLDRLFSLYINGSLDVERINLVYSCAEIELVLPPFLLTLGEAVISTSF